MTNRREQDESDNESDGLNRGTLRDRVDQIEETLESLQEDTEDLDEAVEDDDDEDESVPPSPVEWAARIVSVLLLAILIVYSVRMGLQETKPATFEYNVRTSEITQRDDSWVVPVDITNAGNESMLDLLLTAELVDANDEVVDDADLTFALFGPGEKEEVEVWFDENPSEYELRFNVDGYRVP